jgi:hypothetical protein
MERSPEHIPPLLMSFPLPVTDFPKGWCRAESRDIRAGHIFSNTPVKRCLFSSVPFLVKEPDFLDLTDN